MCVCVTGKQKVCVREIECVCACEAKTIGGNVYAFYLYNLYFERFVL